MHSTIAPSVIPVGTIKSFGAVGPKYEVGMPLRQLPDGDWLISIHLVETGDRPDLTLTPSRLD